MILSVCDMIISLNTATICVILDEAYRLKLSVGRDLSRIPESFWELQSV